MWLRGQGLAGRRLRSVSEVLRTTGWMHTAGSAGPYLSLRARISGMSREEMDRAIFADECAVETVTLRGCTMLLPREDVGLALYFGAQLFEQHLAKLSRVCAISERTLEQNCDAVLRAIEQGCDSAEALRKNLPPGMTRSFGEAAWALGESSWLSLALRRLQWLGLVERRSAEKRLDSRRYALRLAPWQTAKGFTAPHEETAVLRELARRFFSCAAPATATEFAQWIGTTRREADEIVSAAGLTDVTVHDWAPQALAFGEGLKARQPRDAGSDNFLFLPFRDNYLYLRRGIGAFVRPEERNSMVLDWNKRMAPVGAVESLHHHAVIWRGLLIGIWDYDPKSERVVWGTFRKLPAAQRRRVAAEAEGMGMFIREELGDLTFYAADNLGNREARLAAIRTLQT
jgi:hypothetical protein